MYYHVRISTKSKKSHDETKVDLSEDLLYERIIYPYEQGEPIIINGRTIEGIDLDRIMISKSEQSSSVIIRQLKSEDRASPVLSLGGPTYEWRAANKAPDITDEIIKGTYGYKKGFKIAGDPEPSISKNEIFVVHGHDDNLKNDIEVFLHNLKLNPIILHRKPDEGLTIIEKFEKNSNVPFAIILLTPDDLACKATEDLNDLESKVKPRARQNVVFEFGYFIGKLGRNNVCCIYKEGVELPSDISGLLYKRVEDDIEAIGYSLIKEFKAAGLEPKV